MQVRSLLPATKHGETKCQKEKSMQIIKCEFFIPKSGGGVIFGKYNYGEGVVLSGIALGSGFNGWTGASLLGKEDQIEYLKLLQDAVKLNDELFCQV